MGGRIKRLDNLTTQFQKCLVVGHNADQTVIIPILRRRCRKNQNMAGSSPLDLGGLKDLRLRTLKMNKTASILLN